jgi:hypothetical protein
MKGLIAFLFFLRLGMAPLVANAAAEPWPSGAETAAAPVRTWRAYRIHADVFDYLFTAYTQRANGEWSLSFNHRDGGTRFVRVGERLGVYRLIAFEPSAGKVFVASVNAWQERKGGRAILRSEDGALRTLEMGQPLEVEGRRAVVACMETGDYWNVRVGDPLATSNAIGSVVAIGTETVTVEMTADGSAVAIPAAEPEEKEALARLWSQQNETRRRREEWARHAREQQEAAAQAQRAAAAQARRAERQAQAEARATRSRPSFHYGTEYRYPTAYEVVWLTDGSDGKLRPVIVPSRFATRATGFTWDDRGVTVASPPRYHPPPYYFPSTPDAAIRSSAPRSAPTVQIRIRRP